MKSKRTRSIEKIEASQAVQAKFSELEEIAYFNHQKVLRAFQKNKVASEHFFESTGYGHDDLGRQVLDQVFADIFQTESALVRSNFVSGTHAISCALFGNLKAGESLLLIGKLYDTLEPVLQELQDKLKVNLLIFEPSSWQLDLLLVELKDFLLSCQERKKSFDLICLQRSRGYSAKRPSLKVKELQELIFLLKTELRAKIFVDNCYGEFVEKEEITEFGADLIAGSLIKNPGAGIVKSGAYLAGKKELVQKAAAQLTAPGIFGEGGVCFGQKRLLFQGIYLAPMITREILKSMILAARVFQELELETEPNFKAKRTDIIQRVQLKDEQQMLRFCEILQKHSPVDSHLKPLPDYSPGYQSKVIMASGTFIQGATSELSADGPIREPFCIYLQGGLSYLYSKIFLEKLLKIF